MQNWQCRWSPTLGSLEDTHQNVWGTDDYTDNERPTVFFGLYGLPDFYALWRHKGEKHILWAGTDITHFRNGYWLDENGEIRVSPYELAHWIRVNCTSWVENDIEAQKLQELGILSKVCPSFLGDVNQFEVSFKPGNKVYTSVSGDNFRLYGWDKISELARQNPDIEFHLYGNSKSSWIGTSNTIVHGRVPKEQMNTEIKEMQGALRLTEFDGFSEILAKSILMGQYPVSLIKYPYMLSLEELGTITEKKEPNIEGRNHYLKTINQFPWTKK